MEADIAKEKQIAQKNKWIFAYEVLLFTLACVTFALVFIDENQYYVLDLIVWLIFTIDVLIRFILSKNKTAHLKKNPLDLIIIIPFDAVFQLARIARVIRALRLLVIISRYASPLAVILNKHGLGKAVTFMTLMVFLSSIPIVHLEPNIETYADALWWSIVTTTTVGYGDISPSSPIGRLIAVFLMLFGIGLIGIITASITSYFLTGTIKEESTQVTYMKEKINELDHLTAAEIDILIKLLEEEKRNRDTR
ncbi:potassium channel family protein [Alkalihalophilus pseudofirmus]|uniref:Potassium channel family protein n=1 Tax=Alkalihalophilus pseudofirmus TaxID=79885 RepID=A0AAJ2NN90_ALKPS|nr:potassium channel family protein [Alkalihalophilus pseudofirmus]MDV2885474.1 potassium channel family protein [Alkalihalophilus pseudofirmus]